MSSSRPPNCLRASRNTDSLRIEVRAGGTRDNTYMDMARYCFPDMVDMLPTDDNPALDANTTPDTTTAQNPSWARVYLRPSKRAEKRSCQNRNIWLATGKMAPGRLSAPSNPRVSPEASRNPMKANLRLETRNISGGTLPMRVRASSTLKYTATYPNVMNWARKNTYSFSGTSTILLSTRFVIPKATVHAARATIGSSGFHLNELAWLSLDSVVLEEEGVADATSKRRHARAGRSATLPGPCPTFRSDVPNLSFMLGTKSEPVVYLEHT
mmetsp:Transcript_7111/g.13497  ORF Transcript_7111/g.13497 Transcript_7111/m.13497 type:complete len:269 (+) Transcript_7111:424-1230(+)